MMKQHQHRTPRPGSFALTGVRFEPREHVGGEPEILFPAIPEDFSALDGDALQQFIDSSVEAIRQVADAPAEFVTTDRSAADVIAATEAQVAAVESARAQLSEAEPEAEAEAEPEAEPAEEAEAEEPTVEETEQLAALAARLEVEEAVPEVIVAAAPPARVAPPRAARSRAAAPQNRERELVALTAGAGALGFSLGDTFPDELSLAEAMNRRLNQFEGDVPNGTHEKFVVARADWRDRYPSERTLGMDEVRNDALIAAATDTHEIRREFDRRRAGALVASGGLCAPVTPYYDLMLISQADRPVRGTLPSFNADRGGIRYATPPALSAITTGVGSMTAAQDQAGGTAGTKTCQVVSCPPFSETDVNVIFHCLQFGNLGARTFPERVQHYNGLTLAAHSRLAESVLLTNIGSACTAVTAGDLGLGASAALPGQILAAAAAIRSRNRMAPDAVLRAIFPAWVIPLFVSDVTRNEFDRFDVDVAKVTALLRSWGIEPSFHLDGAAGKGQVFGSQAAGALLAFPSTCVWYIYPEGSFIYLDGGTLELGLVRDSVLNKTNDFQIFGETFENVAFLGVEALQVTSSISDTGALSALHTVTDPVSY